MASLHFTNGWRVMLLAAGLTLLPAPARSQDVPDPEALPASIAPATPQAEEVVRRTLDYRPPARSPTAPGRRSSVRRPAPPRCR